MDHFTKSSIGVSNALAIFVIGMTYNTQRRRSTVCDKITLGALPVCRSFDAGRRHTTFLPHRAEEKGFEPLMPFPTYVLSRDADSTALALLRSFQLYINLATSLLKYC